MDRKDYLEKLLGKLGSPSLVPTQRMLTRSEMQSVPIDESGEALVPIPNNPKIILLPNTLIHQFPIGRKRLVDKLVEAAESLPEGLCLGIREIYRPASVQIAYRESSYKKQKQLHPEKTDDELWKIVDGFIARPGGPHQTGGAVDVTLVWTDTKEPLDMGTMWSCVDKKSYTSSTEISWEAQVHRYLLWSYMTAAGFRNYPVEWWHYEYGTARWAKYLSLSHAFYSAKELLIQ
jgi:D-alanyl-D-alanine dipeptidase